MECLRSGGYSHLGMVVDSHLKADGPARHPHSWPVTVGWCRTQPFRRRTGAVAMLLVDVLANQ